MTLEIPKVEGSRCTCSFCILVLGIQESGEMEERDKEKYVAHLKLEHGLGSEIQA